MRTLFEKIWEQHVVADLGDGFHLLHVDRNLINDPGARGLAALRLEQRPVRNPELAMASPDHIVSSAAGRAGNTPNAVALLSSLREETSLAGIRLFDVGQRGQGILHVTGPELGASLPGSVIVCSDSHTCTHGGIGALAFGIGSTEFKHVVATQTIVQEKPKQMRISLEGEAAPGISAKDLILYVIGELGTAAGNGYAIEYAGAAVRALGVEARLTLCNLSIELGAKVGLVAPDDKVFQYLKHRPLAPSGEMWAAAQAHWHTLFSDDGAAFDTDLVFDISHVSPQVTWGTTPEHVIGIGERIPDPASVEDGSRRAALEDALSYMGLRAGQPIAGTPIDYVFIGSCTNARLSDLRIAAKVVGSGRVAPGVTAWVVPGSEGVKQDAEAEGLDLIFKAAGFDWREPGCSMCVAANGETVPPGKRVVSTSNRNFVGRQGPGARTHLASPATAAKSAIEGVIAKADVR